jgi:hypothetical protein
VVTSAVLSGLGFGGGHQSPAQGAATPLFLALDESVEGKTGGYYDGKAERQCQFKKDSAANEKLWQTLAAL